MIRHSLAEGWLLLRGHLIVTAILALSLAVPICLGGVTLILSQWLEPIMALSHEKAVIPILLHPQMDEERRTEWVETQKERQPDWELHSVPPEELAERLARWFPYLGDVLKDDDGAFLPPLVEIKTSDVDSLSALETSPAVIAIGPRSSVHHAVGGAANQFAIFLAILSAVLLTSAAALAAVWVHLEVLRHGDEITIMRLVGATESAIRGPFLLAVTVPGLAAGLASCVGSVVFAVQASHLVEILGLPTMTVSWWILTGQIVIGCALPLVAGMLTLARHARLELEV